jgi:outer membrane lipoprotein-sorting protein
VKQLGWRAFPTRLTVTPQEAGRQTVITYGEMEFDVPIPEDTFSVHRLQQGR